MWDVNAAPEGIKRILLFGLLESGNMESGILRPGNKKLPFHLLIEFLFGVAGRAL